MYIVASQALLKPTVCGAIMIKYCVNLKNNYLVAGEEEERVYNLRRLLLRLTNSWKIPLVAKTIELALT